MAARSAHEQVHLVESEPTEGLTILQQWLIILSFTPPAALGIGSLLCLIWNRIFKARESWKRWWLTTLLALCAFYLGFLARDPPKDQ